MKDVAWFSPQAALSLLVECPWELENTVESLVQRIIDGAGQKDPRFRCCHLIALHRERKMKSHSLEYLVTLDALSNLSSGNEECTLEEGPVGYGKIRLSGRLAERWGEFLLPTGLLCRDKVIERWVQLVASCAQARVGGGLRVLSARAATKALPYQYCYLERDHANNSKLEHRLAIVEGAAWVMVRVGAGEAEAKLALGVRAAPTTPATVPRCPPLAHPLALLYYTAVQTDMYAVAIGPPSSNPCPERQAIWQLWHPAFEAALDAHCEDSSAPALIAAALNALMDRLRDGVVQGSVRALSRYAAWCALRKRLERCGWLPTAAARCCASTHVAHHMLLVLDSLISVCENKTAAGYLYPVERDSLARRGARLPDAEWRADAHCLRAYLTHLHAFSAKAEDIPLTPSETLELVLFSRWESVIRESRSQNATAQYSRRQLTYIWRLARELLNARNNAVNNNHSAFRANLIQATSADEECVEDVIHVLAIMLDQARDLYLQNNYPQPMRTAEEVDREHVTYRLKKWNKLKDYYDASSACLIDTVRRDPDLKKEDFSDETNIIKNILNWLYKGAKDDKKYLGPVLKPFLDSLYTSSLENSMFLEDFDSKKCATEHEGLKDYCLGVHEGHLDPSLGLLNAAKKFAWAKAVIDFIDRSKHVGTSICPWLRPLGHRMDSFIIYMHGRTQLLAYGRGGGQMPSPAPPSLGSLLFILSDRVVNHYRDAAIDCNSSSAIDFNPSLDLDSDSV
ncbi:hypothetical protein EVAR_94410_1 [Eumeta japonica]|uniref:Mab-21-like HhH/H2TH-like domain-containing protein n=1 Tax=Eumeta variegata TaxID=151549 RepID=A0A4C1TQ05_EUMVA|nr:hypothetical protein EVAR_94410_1 [Eumeta japonica]